MNARRALLLPAALLLAACSRERPRGGPATSRRDLRHQGHQHGGWPFSREITPLLEKPNAYLDFSGQSLRLSPATLAGTLREWLEHVPGKVMFATDAYPYSNELGWEESGWISARNGREALGRALTAMLRDGGITHARAVELARMVLRENARGLYGF